MARMQDLERADSARPGGQKDKQAREIARRKRNTRMGVGSGADFCDGAIVPTTLGSIRIPDDDVTMTLRMIRDVAQDDDERIELLTIILGE